MLGESNRPKLRTRSLTGLAVIAVVGLIFACSSEYAWPSGPPAASQPATASQPADRQVSPQASAPTGWQPSNRAVPADLPKEVAEQIKLLVANDPKKRALGAWYLGRMGEKAAPAIPWLVDLLHDPYHEPVPEFSHAISRLTVPSEFAAEALVGQAAADFAGLPRDSAREAELRDVFICGDFFLRVDEWGNDQLQRKLSDLGLRLLFEPFGEFIELLVLRDVQEAVTDGRAAVERRATLRVMRYVIDRLVRTVQVHEPWVFCAVRTGGWNQAIRSSRTAFRTISTTAMRTRFNLMR